MKTELEKALEWWNSLTEYGKSVFEKPKSDDDILKYYQDPAGWSLPPNISY